MNILIGNNIKRLRKQKGITQEQLAYIFNVSPAAVCKWETEESYPDITLIPELAYYFEVSVDELIGYDATKIEKEIIKIIKEYDNIPNEEKFNGECNLIIDARKKYPNDYRIAIRYAYDLIGGYSDNNKDLLIKNSVELFELVDMINSGCNDIKLLIDALNLKAKVLWVLEEKQSATEILDNFPSIYHSTNQRKEQLFDKKSNEYYEVLVNNLNEFADNVGDKLAKLIIYDQNLTYDEKVAKLYRYYDMIQIDELYCMKEQFKRRIDQFEVTKF